MMDQVANWRSWLLSGVARFGAFAKNGRARKTILGNFHLQLLSSYEPPMKPNLSTSIEIDEEK